LGFVFVILAKEERGEELRKEKLTERGRREGGERRSAEL
jgi:hypothetical protein